MVCLRKYRTSLAEINCLQRSFAYFFDKEEVLLKRMLLRSAAVFLGSHAQELGNLH